MNTTIIAKLYLGTIPIKKLILNSTIIWSSKEISEE